MTRTDQWKLGIVLLATVISVVLLPPSIQYYSRYFENRTAEAPVQKFLGVPIQAIHLGLDLQGGMHLLLELDRSKLSDAEARTRSTAPSRSSATASTSSASPSP